MKKLTAAILVLTMLAASCMTAFSASFSDVGDEFAWASEAIDKFSEENIIVGKSDGVFAPDDNVTRAEFAKLLVLTFKLKSDKSAEYSDVAKDFWGYEYINAAYGYTVEANVLDNTCANDVFMPDNAATRQEIAAAIAKAADLKESENENYLADNFTDSADVNSEIYSLVQNAAAAGLIKGYEDRTLVPDGKVTRAEAAVLLYRAREYKKANNTPKPTAEPTAVPTSEPTTEPTTEPTAKPTPTPTSAPLVMPRASVDVVMVESVEQTSYDGDRGYAITYVFGGIIYDEPLIVSENAVVSGVKSSLSEIEKGDLIVFGSRNKNVSKAVTVILSPMKAYERINAGAVVSDVIDLSALNNWGLYNSSAVTRIYFGKLEDVKNKDGGAVLKMSCSSASDQTVFVPSDNVRISRYNVYKNSEIQRFEKISLHDIYAEEEIYAFVREKRDVVTDVILIDYTR